MKRVSSWRLWRLNGGLAYLVLFGSWFTLAWIFGRAVDWAYLASIHLAQIGPTVLFGFLLIRHCLLHETYSRPELVARVSGGLIACGISAWSSREIGLLYEGTDDAPRGLLWDFNIVCAPLLGMVATFVARLVVNPAALLRGRESGSD